MQAVYHMERTGGSTDIAACHAAERVALWDRQCIHGPFAFFLHPALMKSMRVTLQRQNISWGLRDPITRKINRYDISNSYGISINQNRVPGNDRTSGYLTDKMSAYLQGPKYASRDDQVIDLRAFMHAFSSQC